MSESLPYAEAIHAFDPTDRPAPILGEPLQRIALEARTHLNAWDKNQLDHLAGGLDRLYTAVESKDPILGTLMDWDDARGVDDLSLLGFERGVTAALYRNFVCKAVDGAGLADALMMHALGAAAQANAIAHRVAEQESFGHADCEAVAGRAMHAQELLGTAYLAVNGVLFAKRTTSIQRRKAADARHRETKEIKRRFADFYNHGNFRTKSDAARQFYRQLSEGDQKILAPVQGAEGAVRTLREYLNQSKQ